MRTAHRIVGFAFVAVFLATGLFMRLRFPEAHAGDVGTRMLYRSAHVYILLAALINLVGSVPSSRPGRLLPDRIGSWCLLLSPVLFTVAFFVEPAPNRLARPVSLAGVALAAIGAVLRVVAAGSRTAVRDAAEED